MIMMIIKASVWDILSRLGWRDKRVLNTQTNTHTYTFKAINNDKPSFFDIIII